MDQVVRDSVKAYLKTKPTSKETPSDLDLQLTVLKQDCLKEVDSVKSLLLKLTTDLLEQVSA